MRALGERRVEILTLCDAQLCKPLFQVLIANVDVEAVAVVVPLCRRWHLFDRAQPGPKRIDRFILLQRCRVRVA